MDIIKALTEPDRLFTPKEVLSRPSPVPNQPGIHAWYFADEPDSVPTKGCNKWQGKTLLYVGVAPNTPPKMGKHPSPKILLNRLRHHLRGAAYSSILRLTLGCLLRDTLDIQLRRTRSEHMMTFADGEKSLSKWIERQVSLVLVPQLQPWTLKADIVSRLSLPLNLSGNSAHSFYQELTDLRNKCKARAKELPILNKKNVTLDEALEIATCNNRVCPMAGLWAKLYELLPNKRDEAGNYRIERPLILWAWSESSNYGKIIRLREHIEWAADQGCLDVVYNFLAKLKEEEWLHADEYG